MRTKPRLMKVRPWDVITTNIANMYLHLFGMQWWLNYDCRFLSERIPISSIDVCIHAMWGYLGTYLSHITRDWYTAQLKIMPDNGWSACTFTYSHFQASLKYTYTWFQRPFPVKTQLNLRSFAITARSSYSAKQFPLFAYYIVSPAKKFTR